MKQIVLVSFSILSFLFSNAQQEIEVAQKIAQKMKDSLSLSNEQKEQVYQINLQLHNQKMVAREQNANIDSLTKKVQLIENSRDLLYKPVLTNEQYLFYRQKKKDLISNN